MQLVEQWLRSPVLPHSTSPCQPATQHNSGIKISSPDVPTSLLSLPPGCLAGPSHSEIQKWKYRGGTSYSLLISAPANTDSSSRMLYLDTRYPCLLSSVKLETSEPLHVRIATENRFHVYYSLVFHLTISFTASWLLP